MTTLREVVAYEEELLAGSAPLRRVHAEAVARGRAGVRALHEADGVADPQLESRLERLYAEVLDDYAAGAAGLLSSEDTDRWRAFVERLPANGPMTLLREHGVPGAARLFDSMDLAREGPESKGGLDTALSAAAKRCVCGYATTRVVPRQLCNACARAVGAAWVAEERSLLQRAPGLGAEVSEVLDEVTSDLAAARSKGTDDSFSTEEAALFRARRALARAHRRHRKDSSILDLTRWEELAALARRASLPAMRAEARRGRRRLGTAQLAQLALYGNRDVDARRTR
ncbi:hypothetical protein [uncultured Microbacterium sp.]|uniref:hypothetical protein n=1 Tax=uncultured Microbacterium sp. TaxID=191216 RepID=UPI0025FCA7B3|nr:hypothetical protein [uncultured Microbacterium sp.]